jgi:CRISPR-associated protein Cst2
VHRRAFIASIMKVTGNVNADIGVGTRVPLKKILTSNQETKVFVSARCVRRCIRERLYEKNLPIDPLQLIGPGERRQLGDVGDPIKYVDDDIFGYLIPEEVPLKRSSPIKISHLISLQHTEIKPEFAGRFQRDFLKEFERGYPAPFEIEIAEWLGRLGVIVSDGIGRFGKDEIKEEYVKNYEGKLIKSDSFYYLDPYERSERLKAFLEILLWEGWQFPRAAQSPSIPEFYYCIIALTEHFVPIFGFVTIDENKNISQKGLDHLKDLYGSLIDKLYVLNHRNCSCQTFVRKNDNLTKEEEEKLDGKKMKNIISDICKFIVPETPQG